MRSEEQNIQPGEVVFFSYCLQLSPQLPIPAANLYLISFCRKLPKTLGVVERSGSTLKISVQR